MINELDLPELHNDSLSSLMLTQFNWIFIPGVMKNGWQHLSLEKETTSSA